jgi:hypothetical protein
VRVWLLRREDVLHAAVAHAFVCDDRSGRRYDAVAGRVHLAGKIVEHELGYRAERMRIAELRPFRGTEPTVARFAQCLGVPAGEPIDPRDPLESLSQSEVRFSVCSPRAGPSMRWSEGCTCPTRPFAG